MFFTEFSDYLGVELVARAGFSIVRYLLAAGIGYWIFYVWKYRAWYFRKIQQRDPDKAHIQHEIAWSVLSRVIFAFIAIGVLQYMGQSAVYYSVSDYGWWYLVGSALGVVLIHDTYFYWIHRWMHQPRFYRWMHRVHHHSTNPTPFAAFSFHPTEAIVESAIFPLLVFCVPLHPIALLFALLFQVVFNVYGHSGFELAPKGWVRHRFLKYINTSVHHNYHHKEFHYNFGLYFNYWDRWMGTLDPAYEAKFDAVVNRTVNKPIQTEDNQRIITKQTII